MGKTVASEEANAQVWIVIAAWYSVVLLVFLYGVCFYFYRLPLRV